MKLGHTWGKDFTVLEPQSDLTQTYIFFLGLFQTLSKGTNEKLKHAQSGLLPRIGGPGWGSLMLLGSGFRLEKFHRSILTSLGILSVKQVLQPWRKNCTQYKTWTNPIFRHQSVRKTVTNWKVMPRIYKSTSVLKLNDAFLNCLGSVCTHEARPTNLEQLWVIMAQSRKEGSDVIALGQLSQGEALCNLVEFFSAWNEP